MPVMNILPKTTYNADASSLPSGQMMTVPIALNLPVADYREAVVLLRVHDFVGGSGATAEVQVFNSAASGEDPSKVFRGTAALFFAKATYDSVVAPGLVTGSVAAGIGEAFDVLLLITQATSGTTISVTVSVDLVLKRS